MSFSGAPKLKPGVPLATRNAPMPLAPGASLSRQ